MVVEEVNPPANNLMMAKPTGVPQDQIDNIMGGISNTGNVRMNNHKRRLRQSFDIIKRLGQGTYGKVQLGINKETGQEVAIKTIKKCKIEAEADLIRIRREVQIMSSVQHPNIIHIYEVFESREKLILVMEFAAGGELYDYLSERKVLSEDEARRIFRQISTAVYYCHKHKICHRDLKLENILLDEHGNAKIADFGLSNVFDDRRLLSTFCGSPLYASPEIVEGTPYQGPEVDCWSLGVLLYTLVYGSMPFDGSNFKRLVKQISTGDYYEPKDPSPASPLIRNMLTVCPQKRATIEQICSHWWVNENYKESCLDLAENLANQTPVRLDVLLSLSPAAITAEQLVVPSTETKTNERVLRSHSVGSIRDMAPEPPPTEAERRILDMVAAGGEAALMPSSTRTITPAQSPVQSKRKLETTISTENAAGVVKKKERPTEKMSYSDMMEVDPRLEDSESTAQTEPGDNENLSSPYQLGVIENLCDKLMQNENVPKETLTAPITREETVTKLDAVKEVKEDVEKEMSPTKVIKKFVNKHKTADLVAEINKITPSHDTASLAEDEQQASSRKNSLPDESVTGKISSERRRSRILETAEKFQNLNNTQNNKQKKIVIPGVSVGNFKKEFERKASLTGVPKSLEKRNDENRNEPSQESSLKESKTVSRKEPVINKDSPVTTKTISNIEKSNSKAASVNFSLEEARRSMENSIALLNQAKDESTREVEQLCAKTENVVVSDVQTEREKKLKNAREIISNAIQPGGRLCMGARKPPVPYGINGRSISSSVVSPTNTEKITPLPVFSASDKEVPFSKASEFPLKPPPENQQDTVKTSKAEITLKSATLPRRKTAKTEIKLDIKPRIPEQPTMHFSTEMQHEVPDLRTAPVRTGPPPSSSFLINQRATSLEPQTKEYFIPIQKPSAYTRNNSNSLRSGSSSRQSTIESEGEVTSSTVTSSHYNSPSQPIKKSPREFIIPIAVEGGGYVTPRSGSLEPSESNHGISNSTFSHIGKSRRIGSLLSEMDSEEESPFQKFRSMSKDGKDDRFGVHRLRSSRPLKKLSQDNDSQSSGEEDDEDGFEILTAENLFSTLLQRVRALTNRLNVNNDIGSRFGSSRLLSRQPHSSLWNHDPFRSRLNNDIGNTPSSNTTTSGGLGSSSLWRQNLGSDIEPMFSRANATLPRGKSKSRQHRKISSNEQNDVKIINNKNTTTTTSTAAAAAAADEETLDLADLDLSRLRLTKKDLETLSTITPGLPKCFQEQLLAKLPPTQARKLSRTLSMQNNSSNIPKNFYIRSLSSGRELEDCNTNSRHEKLSTELTDNAYDKQQQRENTLYNREARRENCDSHRRSTSRSRCKENDLKSSNCRNSSQCGRSFCAAQTANVNDKYKYYFPYLDKGSNIECSNHLNQSNKLYENSDSTNPQYSSPTKGFHSESPSFGYESSPVSNPENLSRRRLSRNELSKYPQETISDFSEKRNRIRSENLEKPKEKRCRSVEKSLFSDKSPNYEILIANKNQDRSEIPSVCNRKLNMRHVRNNSLEPFRDSSPKTEKELEARRRRSFSKQNEPNDNDTIHISKNLLANQILEELQHLAETKEKHSKKKSVSGVKESHNYYQEPEKSKPNELILKLPKSTRRETLQNKNNEEMKESFTTSKSSAKTNEKSDKAETRKKDSKLIRPKSYPSKEPEKYSRVILLSDNNLEVLENNSPDMIPTNEKEEFDATRPKSYPYSKIKFVPASKDIRKFNRSGSAISKVVEKMIEKTDKNSNKSLPEKNIHSSQKDIPNKIKTNTKDLDEEQKSEQQNMKNGKPSVEVVDHKKDIKNKLLSKIQDKEKILPKKPSKGLLYTLGQKFEKLRENTRSKEKKLFGANDTQTPSKQQQEIPDDKGKISNPSNKQNTVSEKRDENPPKISKKSRINTAIRSLRDSSMIRSSPVTESGLIKKATSVEDLSRPLNKNGANKVLELFKKFEKDNTEKKVINTRSTSSIETRGKHCILGVKSCNKSGSFVNRTCQNTTLLPQNKENKNIPCNQNNENKKKIENNENFTEMEQFDCAVKKQEKQKDAQLMETPSPNFLKRYETKNYAKEKRKGLMLDLSKQDNKECTDMKQDNCKRLLENCCSENYINNNRYASTENQEINQNHLLLPSNENIACYSSDSKSPNDDCASYSTLLSPSEEPELSFDNWSICSEDNFTLPTPTTGLSRISRSSQFSSPINYDSDHRESISDRIKRRSFYCRFNEKKPKRQSSIVGTGARDYYRETASKSQSHISKSISTIEKDPIESSHNLLKAFKRATNFINLKPPVYIKPATTTRKYSTETFPSTTTLNNVKRGDRIENDFLRKNVIKTTDDPLNYCSKRRCLFRNNGIPLLTTSPIDSYATLRRHTIRPYEHRSISMLDSSHPTRSSISPTNYSSYRQEYRHQQPTELGNLLKSTTEHYRTSQSSTKT